MSQASRPKIISKDNGFIPKKLDENKANKKMDWLPVLSNLTSPQIIVSRILAPVINIDQGWSSTKTNNFPYKQIDPDT